jgi:hypothetical protein
LNALSPDVRLLQTLPLLITDEKFTYLLAAGKLARTSLARLGREGLASYIEEKIERSYIYSLRIRPEHGVSTFTIMLEGHHDEGGDPFRVEATLHYDPDAGHLRLVTMM